jgi:ABC-type polysaccharide/polyol phosphate export permease
MIGFAFPLTWAVLSRQWRWPSSMRSRWLAVILATVTVRYHDLAALLTNLVSLWFFLTPILYPDQCPPLSSCRCLNPMTAIMAYQDALYHGRFPSAWMLARRGGTLALLAVALGIYERWRWTLVGSITVPAIALRG